MIGPLLEPGSIAEPFALFDRWFAEARTAEPAEPNAMALATADAAGRPSVRIVLLKAWDRRGFVFYTNLESRKGRELAVNPYAEADLYWKSLERQVRLAGRVGRVSDTEADAYFASRPRASQLGAWASSQSRPLADRRAFTERLAEVETRFDGQPVPRPPFWGGFRITPERIEFWQGRANRWHERLVFEARADGWSEHLLFP